METVGVRKNASVHGGYYSCLLEVDQVWMLPPTVRKLVPGGDVAHNPLELAAARD